jgi:hypothetical protein
LNRDLAREIVRCLRVSDTPKQHIERIARLDRRGWERTLTWLDLTGLTLLFWNRVKESGNEGAAPPQIRVRLDRNVAAHRLRVAEMAREFDSINRWLEAAGAEHAVLKGFSLIPEYCPDPALRTSYDYDYLVRPESMGETERVLRDAGYVCKKGYEHRVVYYQPGFASSMPASRDELYSPAFGRTVELHARLWDPDSLKICLIVPEDALGRRALRHWENARFYALGDEDQLLFQVLHTFRHILHNWCRLRWLFEISHFLEYRSQDSAFWERFCERTRGDGRLSQIAGVVFALATGLFGGRIPSFVRDAMSSTSSVSLSLWVQRYGLDSALDNFSANKFSLFLHREFVQDDATWREVRRTRLFPVQWPNRSARASSAKALSHFAAGWKQGLYVARRLVHHVAAAIQYGWEAPRWQRLRGGDQGTRVAGTGRTRAVGSSD